MGLKPWRLGGSSVCVLTPEPIGGQRLWSGVAARLGTPQEASAEEGTQLLSPQPELEAKSKMA